MASATRSLFLWILTAAATIIFVGGFEMARSSDTGVTPLRSEQARAANDVPPGMMVVVEEDGKLFHRAGCSFIHDKARSRTVTARTAMHQGYTPCVRCLKQYLRTALVSHPDHTAELAEDPILK
ncbi:MAG: hypothetical protein WA172_18300 [Terriglobales bacterium]